MQRTDTLLTALWLIWGALLIIVMVIFTLGTHMFDAAGVREAWAWLLPNLLPPMALVAGVSYQQGKKDASVGSAVAIDKTPTLPIVALGTSGFYLLLLTGSIVGCFFGSDPIDMLRTANLFLGPILAIATAMLATRFAR